jgi:hypothetical protein
MTRHQLVARLIELTPPPPREREADALLEAAEAMLAARAELLADHRDDPANDDDTDPRQVYELAARTRGWSDALAAARDAVGQARGAAAKARAYRQSPRR